MESQNLNYVLLKTAFSCMACDGDVDEKELDLIRDLEVKEKMFNVENINQDLNNFFVQLNKEGKGFLKNFLVEIESLNFNNTKELKIIEVAIKMIKADEVELYSELKFFKLLRSKLKVSDEEILKTYGDVFENLEVDYLSQDIITPNYFVNIEIDYFKSIEIPKFELLKIISDKNEG